MIATFYKNESKEVLKHIVSYFNKQNLPVRTIDNIAAKYRKRNSASYLSKGTRPKKILINSFKQWTTRQASVNVPLLVDLALVKQQLVVI